MAGKWRRKRLSYQEAFIVQKHIILALAGIPADELDQLTTDPSFDVSTSAKDLEEVTNDLAHEFALVSTHVHA